MIHDISLLVHNTLFSLAVEQNIFRLQVTEKHVAVKILIV